MAKLKKATHHVLVCAHKHCIKQGGRDVGRELKRALKELPPTRRALITAVDCLDQCDDGPVVVVYPAGVWYGRVDERCAREIAERHVIREGGEGVRAAGCKVLRDMRGDGGES